jgi:hypothetical protein
MKLKKLSETRLSGTLPMLHQDIMENKVRLYTQVGREELGEEHRRRIKKLEDSGNKVIAVIKTPKLNWYSYILAPTNASEEEAKYFAEDCRTYIALYAFVEGHYNEKGYIGVVQTDTTIERVH